MSVADELTKLYDLVEAGALTKEEYEAHKVRLLSGDQQAPSRGYTGGGKSDEGGFTALLVAVVSVAVIGGLVAFVVLKGFGGGVDVSTPEALAQSLVDAFANEDQEAFRQLFPTADDIDGLRDVLVPLMGTGADFEREKREIVAKADKEAAKAWGKVSSKAARDGATWRGMEVVGIIDRDFKTRSSPVKEADFVALLRAEDGREFRIKLDDCIQVGRGWVMTDDPRWRGTYP